MNKEILNNQEMDLFAILKLLWSKKSKIIFFSTFMSILAIIYVLIVTAQFKSYTSIYPVSENSNNQSFGNIQGIASTFGINLGNKNNSLFNITDLVKSNSLRKKILLNKWNTTKFKKQVNLIKYWEIDDTMSFNPISKIKSFFSGEFGKFSLQKYVEYGLEELDKRLNVIENETGLITVSILMEEPQLAADIVNFIADEIISHVRHDNLLESSDHRIFIENRMDNSKRDLSLSEENLTEFRKHHPIALDTPEIQLERGRLIRDVEVNQQVYITLRQQYELAKIDELKFVPVIKILDKGVAPDQKAKPKRTKIVILTFLISLVLSLYFIYFKERYEMLF